MVPLRSLLAGSLFSLWASAGGVGGPFPENPLFLDGGQSLGDTRTFRTESADLDGDGDQDVLVVDFLGPSRVWINDGTGRFTDSGQALGGEGGHGAAMGDLDGDGDVDVFFVHNGSTDRIFLNDGRGVLVDSGQELGGAQDWGTNVTLADVDGDGDLDAYVTVFQSSGNLWLNDGSGRFSDSGHSLEGNPTSVAFGDFDSDGDLDALATYSGSADRLWLNSGEGVFADSGQRLGPVEGWGFVEAGDVDLDGDLDAVVTNSALGNAVWINDGAGRFTPAARHFGTGARGALGDLDGDGSPDLITTNQERTCSYWLNDGRGGFPGPGTLVGAPGALSVSLADVDGDGDLDALVGAMEGRGGNRIQFNQSLAPADTGREEGGVQVRTGWVEVDGGHLYYEVAGTGEPLLLIHGNTGDRRHWDLQFEALARTHRVIRYDLRGFGSSSVPADGVPYTDHGDAAALLDGLGVEKAHVAGWSLGSAVAIDFAVAFPDRALSLMVVGPWIMGYDSPGAQEMFRGMGQVATAAAEMGPEVAVDALMNAAFMTSTIKQPAAAERFRAIARDYSFWGFVHPSAQMALDPPALGRTGEIRIPTLIVTGAFDVPACKEIGVLLEETIPDSRLVVMPGTGHLMLMEEPEAFNRIVSDFLNAAR